MARHNGAYDKAFFPTAPATARSCASLSRTGDSKMPKMVACRQSLLLTRFLCVVTPTRVALL